MIAIINIFCFLAAFIVTWIFVHGRYGIKQLGIICLSILLTFVFVYLAADLFGIGVVLLGNDHAMSDPEVVKRMVPSFLWFMCFLFGVAYIFEWWYYRKNPDIDPYTGKKKEPADDEQT